MIHLHRSTDKEFYTTIVADNGEPLYTSETVKRRAFAFKTVAAAAKGFGVTWNGSYMDHTRGKKPVHQVAPTLNQG